MGSNNRDLVKFETKNLIRVQVTDKDEWVMNHVY